MCPVKGGATPKTIFESVQLRVKEGKTVKEAIEEIEAILRCEMPDSIIDRIYQECG